MWPLSNITSAQNRTSTTSSSPHSQISRQPHPPNRIIRSVMTTTATTTNAPLFCQMVGCVAQQYDTRSQSPTVMKRNIHCFADASSLSTSTSSASTIASQRHDEVELVYSHPKIMQHQHGRTNHGHSNSSKKLKSASTTYAPSSPTATSKKSKGNIKKDGNSTTDAVVNMSPKKSHSNKQKKTVSFDLIEVREHPRILGDNPSAKKGPPLSIGWYEPADGRILRYSVDEYERRRFGKYGSGSNHTKKKSVEIISPTERQRMLVQDVGVTPSEIFAARMEVSKIRKSRRDHNILVNYDETAVVLEQCLQTVQRFLSYNGTSSENEFRALMEQTERSKQQQQQQQIVQQQQQQFLEQSNDQRLLRPISTIRSPSRIYRQHYQHMVVQ